MWSSTLHSSEPGDLILLIPRTSICNLPIFSIALCVLSGSYILFTFHMQILIVRLLFCLQGFRRLMAWISLWSLHHDDFSWNKFHSFILMALIITQSSAFWNNFSSQWQKSAFTAACCSTLRRDCWQWLRGSVYIDRYVVARVSLVVQ